MKVYNQGVLDTSDVYFHTASELAKRMYFYLLCTGHYHCDGTYVVERSSYNSFLVLYVESGSGYVQYGGEAIPLKAGSVAFIDCYKPHKYYTDTGWETYWVHFDGPLARQYHAHISETGICHAPQNPYNIQRSLHKIFTSFHEHASVNEAVFIRRITDLLTELILCNTPVTSRNSQLSVTEDTLTYISENADQPLSLEMLARRVSLSPYYFTRVFKKETGFTPHEYIIRVRIDLARYFLKTTDLPIKVIAFRCGFNSESGFCTTFKKATGLTPRTYRDEAATSPQLL